MKYQLEQMIYYFMDNKVHSASVMSRMKVENSHDDWAHTNAQKETFTPFGFTRVMYGTCHGILEESQVFGSKEELLNSL